MASNADLGLGECEHEYTPNESRTHAWCQKCDSVVWLDPSPADGSVAS